jgi:hypothetical protein
MDQQQQLLAPRGKLDLSKLLLALSHSHLETVAMLPLSVDVVELNVVTRGLLRHHEALHRLTTSLNLPFSWSLDILDAAELRLSCSRAFSKFSTSNVPSLANRVGLHRDVSPSVLCRCRVWTLATWVEVLCW